jgi:hypothetical protein
VLSLLIFPNRKSRLASIASLSKALVMDPYSLNPAPTSYRLSFGHLLITSRVNWYQKLGYMLTVFICSLFSYMPIVFTYAHYFFYMLTVLYMLTMFINAHYFYICSLSLHMLTVFIDAHCVHRCSLFLYMPTVFTYANCFYISSLFGK